MADFILDADPFIPTGVAATAEQVAAMVADPASPVTADTIPMLTAAQRPKAGELIDAIQRAGGRRLTPEQVSAKLADVLGDVSLAVE